MMENNVSTILEGLDSRQREAVTCVDGPVLIIAGAGSGKTRVLTSRIAYMLEKGIVEPHEVLALTFTRKAAAEMKERIAGMVGERKARRLYMGTFHSVFIRFLREFSHLLGYPAAFTVYDTSDSISLIKACLKEMKLDEKVYKPKDVLSRISNAKNALVTPQAYKQNANAVMNDTHAKKPEICNIYAMYQQRCKQAGVMDFDDILLNMNILLYDYPDVRQRIADRFRYILVDEYQDTNFAQYVILKNLCKEHRNLCVVGDDSQSIYAFRGAKIENILNFQRDYPGCKLFRLEQNYRSTRNIVGAANSLIAKNTSRIPKTCFSEGEDGDKLRLVQAYTEQEEALLVASSIISRMQESAARYQDFAILYRTNSQSRALEEALRRRNLPYVIYSGNAFFDRAEVKDMMAYFKLAVNPADDESFRRVIGKPARGIGDTTVEALSAAARSAGVPLMRAAFLENLDAFGLRNAAVAKLRSFAEMMVKAHEKVDTEGAHEVATFLADASGLYQFFKTDKSIEAQSRAANIEELVNSVKVFVEDRQNAYLEDLMAEGQLSDMSEIDPASLPHVSLGDYLEDVSLLSAVDMESAEDAANRISLMTVHSAKGLEFPYVYITGLEENLFPSGSMLSSETDIEEERRLFYVALTRAKTAVTLSFAATRMRNGKHESNAPSRFVREIDPRFVANPLRRSAEVEEERPQGGFQGFGKRFGGGADRGARPYGGYAYGASGRPGLVPAASARGPVAPRVEDKDFVPVPIFDLKAGQRIEHNRFGLGRIVRISGNGNDLKATIDFDNYGEKILLLKYAKIRFPE